MYNVLLVVYIILAIFLVGLVLIQRSEGGALGGLSGGDANSFMTGRSVGNFLTKATTIVSILFMVSCLVLGIMAKNQMNTVAEQPLSSQLEK